MAKNWTDISLAMAGVFQSAALVDQIARSGYVPSAPYQCSISTLFEQNPSSTEAVFGSAQGLQMGLQIMAQLLSNQVDREHPNTMRYVMSILHLQKKLQNDPSSLEMIADGIQQARRQAEHFDDACHDSVIAQLADIYSNSISRYKFRIQVMGDVGYLQQQRIANQVRSLLLAAIRSAMLWRQVGGSRLDILLQRKKLLSASKQWLERLEPIH